MQARHTLAPPLTPVDKATFLSAIAACDAVMDGSHKRPDAADDVTTVYLLRSGA